MTDKEFTNIRFQGVVFWLNVTAADERRKIRFHAGMKKSSDFLIRIPLSFRIVSSRACKIDSDYFEI